MPADAAERVGFERAVGVRFKVTIAEVGSSWLRLWGCDVRCGGDGSVMPEKRHDVASRRDLDKPLLQPHKQVVDLGSFGLRLRVGDLTERESPLFAFVIEEDAVAAVAFLKSGHGAAFRAKPPQHQAGILTKFLADLWVMLPANRHKSSAGGGNRTHTGVTTRRILSPLRLPHGWHWDDTAAAVKSPVNQ